MIFPDEPTKYDIEMLRYLNGEIPKEKMVFGACTNECSTWLHNCGYTRYWGSEVTQKGKALLEKHKDLVL